MKGWAGQDLGCNGLCQDELDGIKGWGGQDLGCNGLCQNELDGMKGWAGNDLGCNGLCQDELNYQGWALCSFLLSERIVLLLSFKARNVVLRSFLEFLANYETQKNDAFFCVLFLST